MEQISRFEIVRGDRPSEPVSGPTPADVANGMAALRACCGALEGLPVMAIGSVVSSLMAQFLCRWPEHSRGEILRMLNAQANATLEFYIAPPPDSAA